MATDHYRALGVAPGASSGEVRAAYLRIMRQYHPDRRPGDPRATALAQQANAAWAVLGDPRRRAAYDRRPTTVPVRPAARRMGPTPSPPAYSPVGNHYRRAFSLACLRLGAAVLALGAAVLFTLG